MNTNNNFSTVFEELKNNKIAMLPKWSNDVFISVKFPDINSKMTHPYLYVTSRFGCVPWIPTYVELFSIEWIIKDRMEDNNE